MFGKYRARNNGGIARKLCLLNKIKNTENREALLMGVISVVCLEHVAL